MRVAIIGAGAIGQAVGKLLAMAGHELWVSWASSDARLERAAALISPAAHVADPAFAVKRCETVLFSPRFEHVAAASSAVGHFGHRTVIDTTNPYTPERDGVAELGGATAADVVSAQLAGARYVKGFNTLTADFLTNAAGRCGADRVAIFICGDDCGAKLRACDLVRDCGFDPVDLGGLAHSVAIESGGPYYGDEFHLDDVSDLRRI